MAIDPEELEGLDDSAIRQLYDQRLAEEQARRAREAIPLLLNIHIFFHRISNLRAISAY